MAVSVGGIQCSAEAHLKDMARALVGERPRDVVPRVRASDQARQHRGIPVETHICMDFKLTVRGQLEARRAVARDAHRRTRRTDPRRAPQALSKWA